MFLLLHQKLNATYESLDWRLVVSLLSLQLIEKVINGVTVTQPERPDPSAISNSLNKIIGYQKTAPNDLRKTRQL